MYKTILKYQAKPDFSSRVALQSDARGTTGVYCVRTMKNPWSDDIVEDTVYVGSNAVVPERVTFEPKQTPRPAGGSVTVEDGLSCALELGK